jgi:flagellar motor switch/type III secretory pathway protein FliN
VNPIAADSEIARLADIPFAVRVELDRRKIRARDILGWTVGSVIVFKKQAGESVDILVGQVRLGCGEIVASGDTLAVRVTGFRGRS